tara:strand:- start:185 stop:436 length:252 start_codon:yes stop_codon:yes gene_type:complete
MYFNIPQEILEKNASQNITFLGSDMRVGYQSERLTGTGSLLTVNEKSNDHSLQIRQQTRNNKFLVPLLLLGIGLVVFGVVKLK